MIKKRGLGKSLDALLVGSYAVSDEVSPSSDRLNSLSMDLIQRGKYQPRREMDADALQDLSNSIRAQGVIQPIVVRPILGGRYEIVAGERRFRASQMAGLKEIPALIKEIPDEAAVAIALIENIQRENLNPIEEAMALQRLLDEFSMTHQQVAEAIGKSRAAVTNLLRLLALQDDIKNMLEKNEIEMGHARALLTLSEEDQLSVARQIVLKGLSVRETEETVRRHQMPNIKKDVPPVDPDIQRLQQDLSQRIRLPVAISYNHKVQGKIQIRYRSINELEKILEYFE